MKWQAEILTPKHLRFVIEQVQLQDVFENKKMSGFYLYIYEDNRCTHDYLQDTLEAAKAQAFEEFGVPNGNWRRVIQP
jgi:predicted transcriptional regulator